MIMPQRIASRCRLDEARRDQALPYMQFRVFVGEEEFGVRLGRHLVQLTAFRTLKILGLHMRLH